MAAVDLGHCVLLVVLKFLRHLPHLYVAPTPALGSRLRVEHSGQRAVLVVFGFSGFFAIGSIPVTHHQMKQPSSAPPPISTVAAIPNHAGIIKPSITQWTHG
jgi:hypothetical protein